MCSYHQPSHPQVSIAVAAAGQIRPDDRAGLTGTPAAVRAYRQGRASQELLTGLAREGGGPDRMEDNIPHHHPRRPLQPPLPSEEQGE